MIYIVMYNSPGYGGGVEGNVREILRHVSDGLKRDVVLICNNPAKAKEFSFEGTPCVNIKTKRNNILDKICLFSRLHYSYRVYRYLKDELHNDDTVVIFGNECSLFLSLFRARIKRKFTFILAAPGSLYRLYTNYVVKRLPNKYFPIKLFFASIQWYFFLIDKLAAKHADTMIFTSRRNRDYFVKKFNPTADLKVIGDGFQIDKRQPVRFKHEDNFTTIIVGSTVLGKGLDIAVKAVRKVNETKRLTLITVGFDDFYSHFSKNELPDHIHHVGRVRPEEVPAWFQKSDFFILPSRSESFGNVVIESLLNGKPIIVSETCVHADIDYEKYGYILDSYDVEDWVDEILAMMKLKNYNTFCKNIQNLDFSPLDIRNIAQRYEEALNRVR